MRKSVLVILSILFLVVSFSVPVAADTCGDLTFESNNKNVTITDCKASATGILEIPAAINGYPVTSIGGSAFLNCSSLTGIIIPNSCITIGYGAFTGCTSLIEITIPNNVISIGEYAFSGCSSLTKITLSNKIATIPDYTFQNCSKLETVSFPEYLSSIKQWAFINCSSLKEITLPNSVTNLGSGVFNRCTNLTTVTLSSKLTSIENFEFSDCTSLKTINLPNNLSEIGLYAFNNCKKLENVTIPNSVICVEGCAFQGCESLTDLSIPNSVTTIGSSAYRDCSKLKSITISDSVTTIDSGAFENCCSLDSITVSDKNPNYCSENGVLFNKNKTKLILYPADNARISYCIPNSVTLISDHAFENNSNLQNITIPNNIEEIYANTFSNCSSLVKLIIPKKVWQVESAFNNCDSLTTVLIYNNIRIASNAFFGCDNLTLYGFWESNAEYYASQKKIPFNNIVAVDDISLNKTNLNMQIDDTVNLIATIAPINATNKNVIWNSDNANVVTVDQNGKVTAVSAGTANITAAIVDENKTVSCIITVELPIVSVTDISLNKTAVDIKAGDSETLNATILPNDATNKAVTWDSSNSNIATVDSKGKVAAITSGTTTITATTADGSKTATCTVTVSEPPTIDVTDVVMNKANLELIIGGSETLIATVLPANATNKTVRWSTSNPSVAMVTVNGRVTSVSEGTATITVTTVDGGKTATCTVTVTAPPVDKPLENPFTDVLKGKYYYDAVLWAVGNNITKGTSDTTFGPNDACTRCQVVTFIWNAMGRPEPASLNNPFTDVKEGKYYYKAVLWAVEKGITKGMTANTFEPDTTVTRAQFVTFLWSAEGKPEVTVANPFNDIIEGKYYYKAVMWAVSTGVTSGTSSNTFSPNDPCTRGQVVSFLYRDMK